MTSESAGGPVGGAAARRITPANGTSPNGAGHPPRTAVDAYVSTATAPTPGPVPGPAGEPARLAVDRLRAALLDVDAVCALPPPEPLIGELLSRDSLALLYGKPGCGKSFVALDWALCMGTGLPWQGREVHPGRVLYVAAEGLRGLGRRISAWHQAFHGAPWPPAVAFCPHPINLLDRRQADALTALAEQERYALIVIDTLARSMLGGDENDGRAMGYVVEAATRIRQAAEATVLLVHHKGRIGNDPRGHSALDGAVDTAIEAATGKQPGTLVLRSVKQKDDAPFRPIGLLLDPVRLADHTSSCVLRAAPTDDPHDDPHDDAGPDGGSGDRTATGSEQAILGTLQTLDAAAAGMSWTRLLEASELPKASFSRALKALVGRGLVTVDGEGKATRYALTPVAAAAELDAADAV